MTQTQHWRELIAPPTCQAKFRVSMNYNPGFCEFRLIFEYAVHPFTTALTRWNRIQCLPPTISYQVPLLESHPATCRLSIKRELWKYITSALHSGTETSSPNRLASNSKYVVQRHEQVLLGGQAEANALTTWKPRRKLSFAKSDLRNCLCCVFSLSILWDQKVKAGSPDERRGEIYACQHWKASVPSFLNYCRVGQPGSLSCKQIRFFPFFFLTAGHSAACNGYVWNRASGMQSLNGVQETFNGYMHAWQGARWLFHKHSLFKMRWLGHDYQMIYCNSVWRNYSQNRRTKVGNHVDAALKKNFAMKKEVQTMAPWAEQLGP